MTPDRDPDDERPGTDPPLPPEDRLWRHPSEIAAGVSPPSAWLPSPGAGGAQPVGRRFAAGALAGACLAGALVAVGAMWVTRPTKVVERGVPITTVKATTTTSLTFSAVPSERIATDLGPSLPVVRAQHDGAWTSGTGVWLDGKGTVLTATPLVAGSGLVLVTGADGISRRAKVRGADPVTGVTALTVDRTSGTPIAARTTTVRAGEPVVIVGAPGVAAGDESTAATTATALIRVASMRSTIGTLVVHDALQLDRAVPADAAGGLLVDADGRMLGFTLGTSADRGLGIATPVTEALAAGAALRDHGRVDRAWLGVQAVDLDPAATTMLRVAGGARITEVTAGSPAATAGIQVGDVVVKVGHAAVDDASALVMALGALDPGAHVWLTVQRDGHPTDIQVTLGG